MKEEELMKLVESSNLGQENFDDEIRVKIYEYLLTINNWHRYQNEDFIFKIPASSSADFGMNYVFQLHQGVLEKKTNEVVAISLGEELQNSFRTRRNRAKVSFTIKDVLKEEIHELRNMIESLQDSVKKLTRENKIVKDLLYSDASNYGDKKKTQIIPIDIYLDTDEPKEIFEVYDAVVKFANILGFDDTIEFEAIKGSWYKRMIAKTKEKLSGDEIQDRLKEFEYGVEVNTILKQQSEIDKNQSEALANIITSLKDIPNAAIRIGALIVVKLTDIDGSVSLQTRTLSIKELHLLNKKPELLQMPKQILQALAKEIDDEQQPQISNN